MNKEQLKMIKDTMWFVIAWVKAWVIAWVAT